MNYDLHIEEGKVYLIQSSATVVVYLYQKKTNERESVSKEGTRKRRRFSTSDKKLFREERNSSTRCSLTKTRYVVQSNVFCFGKDKDFFKEYKTLLSFLTRRLHGSRCMKVMLHKDCFTKPLKFPRRKIYRVRRRLLVCTSGRKVGFVTKTQHSKKKGLSVVSTTLRGNS